MASGRQLFSLVVLGLLACSPGNASSDASHGSPRPTLPSPPVACTDEDAQTLLRSVDQFITAWNRNDGQTLDNLFAPKGWFALSSDPRHRSMVTVPGRQLDRVARTYWAEGATLRYNAVGPASFKAGDTAVVTQVDGLTIHFPDGTDLATFNKFVVWCDYHALGQGVLMPL